MAYIWINPVVNSMYEPEILNRFLQQHGYRRCDITVNWINVVKEKYRLAVEGTGIPVMDMRCPKIRGLLEESGSCSKVFIPEIHPILIHCAQEVSGQEALFAEEKIITTPCQALADMGNELKLEHTRFVSWNRFIKDLGKEPERILQEKSPIPLGFFEDMGVKTVSITGEDEIRDYFKKPVPEDVRLVEMLFCKEGCHNGDGIRMCE